MRGIAMVLMAVDHASWAFNKGRLFTDSAFFYDDTRAASENGSAIGDITRLHTRAAGRGTYRKKDFLIDRRF
jgi:uncharacterized membrane protein